ncbi:MAG: hypothetical protein Q7V63_06265 [Gammaproteobacteria bacterium]|nr:hypothetical protein [Gammaproteobacteria bacterium]
MKQIIDKRLKHLVDDGRLEVMIEEYQARRNVRKIFEKYNIEGVRFNELGRILPMTKIVCRNCGASIDACRKPRTQQNVIKCSNCPHIESTDCRCLQCTGDLENKKTAKMSREYQGYIGGCILHETSQALGNLKCYEPFEKLLILSGLIGFLELKAAELSSQLDWPESEVAARINQICESTNLARYFDAM